MTRTRIVRVSDDEDRTWVRQYEDHLDASGRLSRAAIKEIRRCTDLAFAHVPSPSDHVDAGDVVGAVVGAVQSGKTSLMVHLAARALDEGFRVVIVLAGLRDDLRTQTARRFVLDLLQRGDPVPGNPAPSFTHVNGTGYHGSLQTCWSPRYSDDVNHDEAFVSQFRNQLRTGRAVLAVAKKNVASLIQLLEAYQFACAREGSCPLLVLDDECDEASVSGDPGAPTPDRIAQVWSGLDQHVTYVGFTATPAANLLQDTSSLLFPRDFVLAMRSPGGGDTALQYLEPDPDSRYTGGEVFYGLLAARGRNGFPERRVKEWNSTEAGPAYGGSCGLKSRQSGREGQTDGKRGESCARSDVACECGLCRARPCRPRSIPPLRIEVGISIRFRRRRGGVLRCAPRGRFPRLSAGGWRRSASARPGPLLRRPRLGSLT